MTKLAIVVVNFGNAQLLRTHLLSVAASLPEAACYVVDNFSTEASRKDVSALCGQANWTGLFPEANLGFGVGCNLGAEAALAGGADILLFLNPDATIDAPSVERLVEEVTADPALLAAPTILTPDGSLWSAGTDLDLDSGEMRSWQRREEKPGATVMPWVSGACFLLSSTLWESIDGFDPDYFLYWEDVDLCARVHARSGRIRVVPEAVAIHDEGRTHESGRGGREKSVTYYYYNVRNRELFAAKWLSATRQRRWRRSSVMSAYRVLLRGGRRQFRRPSAPLGAAWRGLRDGRAMARSVRQTER